MSNVSSLPDRRVSAWRVARAALALAVALTSADASAQGVDLTLSGGVSYPVYDDRLTLRAPVPSLPGVAITSTGTPELRARGGPVFGAAVAGEIGIIGIEGRFDSTKVGLDLRGGRYDLRGVSPPFENLSGRIIIGDGRFDADRLQILSLNARLRTPGPIGIMMSGGLSYLPAITLTGTAPLTVQLGGIPLPPLSPRLRLRAEPGESDSRIGINGGAGLRIGGRHLALVGEVRVFYFRKFELRVDVDDAPALIREALENVAPIQFDPVIVNAQAGINLRF